MLFAIVAQNSNNPENFRVVAVQKGQSYHEIFENLQHTLDKVAKKMGEEKTYMKNYETWGVGNIFFTLNEVGLVTSEDQLVEKISHNFSFVDH